MIDKRLVQIHQRT